MCNSWRSELRTRMTGTTLLIPHVVVVKWRTLLVHQHLVPLARPLPATRWKSRILHIFMWYGSYTLRHKQSYAKRVIRLHHTTIPFSAAGS